MKQRLISLLLAAALLPSLCLSALAAETVEPYGEPWLTSIVDGMVTADIPKPNLKDDFFLYNNYEWLCDTALEPGHTQTGGIVDLKELANEQVAALFTDESIPGREAELVREYYQMCLDWENRAKGKAFFLEHLRPIQDIATLEDLTAYLTSEESMNYGTDIAEPDLVKNPEHPDEWMIDIQPFGLSLTDPAEYTKITPAGENRRRLKDDQALYMLQYAGYSEAEAEALIGQNFEFEKRVAPSMMTVLEGRAADSAQTIHLYTREALAAASPNYPIIAILDTYAFNPELPYNVEQPAWLERLNALYTEEYVPLWRACLLYKQASYAMEYLDEAGFRAYQKLDRAFNGLEESRDDEYEAADFTMTCLSQFVDEMYVKRYTSDKTREDILGLMREIVAVYREMLQQETWLSEETRDKAILKLDTMEINAVYPNARQDWSDYAFRSRSEGGTLLEATRELERCALDLKRKNSFGKPNPGLWPDGSYEVNASYRKQNNSINIYAGILNGDVYREDMTPEELLAGAGTVIAHEISHAFDTSGAQYDETGAYRNWWTDADKAAFDRRVGKLTAYYDGLHPWKDGSAYASAIVQGEAIADLGAMACVIRIAKKTEGFDYDAFFRAYAKLRRRKLTENAFENNFRKNMHPMDHLRVNVVLAQFPEFQQTYGIQPGDGMYVAPEDRIAIWGMNE